MKGKTIIYQNKICRKVGVWATCFLPANKWILGSAQQVETCVCHVIFLLIFHINGRAIFIVVLFS